MLRLRFFTFAAAILLTAETPAAESTRHLCFSRDRGVWIANLDGSGAHKIVTGDDPAVFLFDISTGKAHRVSPAKVYAWDPFWLDAADYLLTSTVDGRHFGIYKASLAGEKPQLVINNASSVTVSAH